VKASELVTIQQLRITYLQGALAAVDGLNLTINAGEVVGLAGGNGAGKTSTLKTLAGIQPASSGLITVAGYPLTHPLSAEYARALIGYCPDTGGLIRQATVREHIGIALALRNRSTDWSYALELVELFNLTSVLDRPTAGFSHGMSRRVSVMLAALTAEKVLILDEPFDGVDPRGVQATKVVIERAKQAGLAVIVSTHLLNILVSIADRLVVMVEGKIVAEDLATSFYGQSGEERYNALLDTPA
jgi:ABC-2 type transport system ATP-binding protein